MRVYTGVHSSAVVLTPLRIRTALKACAQMDSIVVVEIDWMNLLSLSLQELVRGGRSPKEVPTALVL